MHLRSLRSLATFTLPTLVLLGLTSPAAGAPGEKDKDALKLHDDAINNDYLNAEFPKAITKLKDALKLCGTASCSANVVAKIHVSLGTIYGAAMTPPKIPEAQAEFELALKTDASAALDPSLTNPELDKAFAAAKKAVTAGGAGGAAGAGGAGGAGGGKKPPPASSGGDAGIHTPPPEQAINTPVPLYLEPSEEVPLSKVTLRYKPFGSKTYKSAELKKIGKGFGGEIPCDDVTTTGDIKYFFALFDENGEAAGTLGSTKEPYKVTIKNEIEGDAPSLPGKKPPEVCQGVTPCPPDFPGCKEKDKTPPGEIPKEKRGDRGWGASCEETMQCQEGLGCKEGTCQEGAGTDPVGGAGGDWKKWKNTKYHHMVGLGAQFDILSIDSRDNVCSPPGPGETANYSCFVTGTDTQFDGKIVTRTGTNGIQGGGAYADTRIFAAYDLFLFEKKVPVSIGLRFGYAIGGSPTPSNITKNVPPALGFQAISFEARGSYFLLGTMFEKRKPRPYVFVGGGSGQVNAAVPVTVCDSTAKDAATKNNCKTSPKSSQAGVDAYQVTGLGFVEFGGGTTFGITDHFGVAAELKFMFMVPTFGFVFAPTVGPVVAF